MFATIGQVKRKHALRLPSGIVCTSFTSVESQKVELRRKSYQSFRRGLPSFQENLELKSHLKRNLQNNSQTKRVLTSSQSRRIPVTSTMTSVLPQGDIIKMKRCNTSIMPTRQTKVAELQGFYWPRYVTPGVPSTKSKFKKAKPVKVTRPRKNSFSKERRQIEACLKILPKASLDFGLLVSCWPHHGALLQNGAEERQPQHSYAWNPVSRKEATTVKYSSKPVSRLVPVKVSKQQSQRKGLRRSEKLPFLKG